MYNKLCWEFYWGMLRCFDKSFIINLSLYWFAITCDHIITIIGQILVSPFSLQWRHNGCDGVSNHQPHDCLLVYSGADLRKHQSSASLAFVRGIHWWPVSSPHEWSVTRKMFPFDELIMSRREEMWEKKPSWMGGLVILDVIAPIMTSQ